MPTVRIVLLTLGAFAIALLASSCSSQVKAQERYLKHHFVYGKTAYIGADGKAQAPPSAPRSVHKMVAAANDLVGKPYRYGGGHRSFYDRGYDCSGAVSYVLHKGGKLDKTMVSSEFFKYGRKGYGDYVTVYVKKGHVFMEICGLRFDTGGTRASTGPQWKPWRRGLKGYYVRHPWGL
ncbi:C40 family peptidase [Rubritalea marina]|uniref:C40 family peptidase n=1 Tax=Rubritalea marina TaxID=361055 RepID=UPI00038278A5|nr:C40 family peptidase [Rubritalea marina]